MLEENQLSPILDVPPELVLELAVGIDTFDNICRKHGYGTSQIEHLRDDSGLKARVAKAEAELQKDGFTHKLRAGYGADLILRILISRGMDPSTPLSIALDIYKELVKTGDLVPKQALAQQTTNGFSITINIPKIDDQPGRTIEMNSDVNKDMNSVFEAEAVPSMGMSVPTMGTMNRDLNNALALPEDWDE